jgi:potassium-dependent mechanosensitive channel
MVSNDPRLQAFLDQLDNLLLVVERPVVQRQLVVFAAIVLVSWFLAELVHRLLAWIGTERGRRAQQAGQPARPTWQRRLSRGVLAIEYTFFPLLGMLLGKSAVDLFRSNDWPTGLIESWLTFFWLLLGYRIIVTLFYATMEQEAARAYHRRILVPLFAILLIVGLSSNLAGTFSIDQIELVALLDTPISLGTLFRAAVVLFFFLAFGWISQDLLRKFILARAEAPPGVTNTVLTISRYAIIAIGALAAISTLGFNLSALAIIGGGLSVGIGFGMQDLIANFISGILLMFERSLRPGDIIEVGGKVGVVDKLNIRSTVVRMFDNVEIFVPNKNLLTSSVSSYTHNNRRTRRTINVGVSYDNNPAEVRQLLLDIANRHELVLDDPPPAAHFVEFGESSLNFTMFVWVDDISDGLETVTTLQCQIWEEFKQCGIEIPYPQRDLRVRSQVPIHVQNHQENQEASQEPVNAEKLAQAESDEGPGLF